METDFQNKDKLCERIAAAIVKIFEDDNMKVKHQHHKDYFIIPNILGQLEGGYI